MPLTSKFHSVQLQTTHTSSAIHWTPVPHPLCRLCATICSERSIEVSPPKNLAKDPPGLRIRGANQS